METAEDKDWKSKNDALLKTMGTLLLFGEEQPKSFLDLCVRAVCFLINFEASLTT